MSRSQISQKAKQLRLSLIALCALVVALLPVQTPVAHAQPPEPKGYLWNLYFSFDNSFDGVLTVEVGPWQNGNLVAVEETSVTPVRCQPIGHVKLEGGMATFTGGAYLECNFDIGEVVQSNHGLQPNDPDIYGSIVMRTQAMLFGEGVAPIFHHADAQYRLNAMTGPATEISTDLSNENGPMNTTFTTVNWKDLQTYSSNYVCNVACTLEYTAGGFASTLNDQGKPVTFSTGPATFYIGRDDTNFFNGRINSLLIDPGNFAH